MDACLEWLLLCQDFTELHHNVLKLSKRGILQSLSLLTLVVVITGPKHCLFCYDLQINSSNTTMYTVVAYYDLSDTCVYIYVSL